MIKNFLRIFLFAILIVSCGYSPMYSKKNLGSFSIQKLTLDGDSDVNKIIKNKLRRYVKQSDVNGFLVETNTYYKKKSLTKDTAGNTTKYEILIKANFIIKSNKETKDFAITEVAIMKSFENKFDESQYEKTIKNNLSSLISDKLIIRLQN